MCKIWEKKGPPELTLNQINELLDDPIFKLIEFVTLTGGEPTLREDIGQIAKLLVDKCPRLKHIGVPTNGLATELVVKACHAIGDACKGSGVNFIFDVSLDGIEDAHGRVRGIPDAFRRTTKTIEVLKQLQCELGFGLDVHCVVSDVNIMGLSALEDWCNKKRIPFSFEATHKWKRFLNENSNFQLTPDQMNLYLDVLWNRIKGDAGNYYDWMTYRMARLGKKRSLACPFVVNAFNIQANGDVCYCPGVDSIGNILNDKLSNIYYNKKNLKFREWTMKNRCYSCTQSWSWNDGLNRDFLHSLQYTLMKKIMTKIR